MERQAYHHKVADSTLPLLVTLIEARKQARWQWLNCADEHQHRWTVVINRLDERILLGEKVLSEYMDVIGFRMKRRIVE